MIFFFSSRHYYWCIESDKVSWFPPGNPKAIPVLAAAKVRENMEANQKPVQDKETSLEMVHSYVNFLKICMSKPLPHH